MTEEVTERQQYDSDADFERPHDGKFYVINIFENLNALL